MKSLGVSSKRGSKNRGISGVKKVRGTEVRGVLDTLREFGKLLKQMEKKGVRERSGSGLTTIVGLPAKYRYHIRLGIKPGNFFLSKRHGGSRRSEEKVEIKRIVLSAPGGKIANDISIPNCKVKGALSKDGILEIMLTKSRISKEKR